MIYASKLDIAHINTKLTALILIALMITLTQAELMHSALIGHLSTQKNFLNQPFGALPQGLGEVLEGELFGLAQRFHHWRV